MDFRMTLRKKIELEDFLLHSSRIETASPWFDHWSMRWSFKTSIRWTTTNFALNLWVKPWPSERESSHQSRRNHFKTRNWMALSTAQWSTLTSLLSMTEQSPTLKMLGTTCVRSNAEEQWKNVMKFTFEASNNPFVSYLSQRKLSRPASLKLKIVHWKPTERKLLAQDQRSAMPSWKTRSRLKLQKCERKTSSNLMPVFVSTLWRTWPQSQRTSTKISSLHTHSTKRKSQTWVKSSSKKDQNFITTNTST